MSDARTSHDLVVGGLVPLTTTDLPGMLSAVVFCQGCPWRCRYCHNPHLVPPTSSQGIPWSEVMRFLARRRGLLDAVVFSGGEPTMQPAIVESVRSVASMGYLVGLHTAGQYPDVLAQLLPHLYWVGMDIKAPPGRYRSVTGRSERWEVVRQSAFLVISSGVKYEFRTTAHPSLLSIGDLRRIGDELRGLGASRYVVQQYRSQGCQDTSLNLSHRYPTFEELAPLAGVAPEVWLRGDDFRRIG